MIEKIILILSALAGAVGVAFAALHRAKKIGREDARADQKRESATASGTAQAAVLLEQARSDLRAERALKTIEDIHSQTTIDLDFVPRTPGESQRLADELIAEALKAKGTK